MDIDGERKTKYLECWCYLETENIQGMDHQEETGNMAGKFH